MDGVLHGVHAASQDLRAAQEATARWLEGFLAPGYGPHGGAKLVDGPEPLWVRSPAVALREVQATPDLAPYQDLAARVLTHGGDGGTTAALLAARLVRLALTSQAGVAAFVQGYPLARRQALAALAAQAAPSAPAAALAACSPGGEAWSQAVLGGLARERDIDLDAIEVVAEPRDAPGWLPGVPLDPQRPPAGDGVAKVLVLSASWKLTPATAASWRSPAGALAAEEALRRRTADHIAKLGVGLVACSGAVDDGLAGLLQDRKVAVATDVALSRLRRLAAATGASPVARVGLATAADVGTARLERRPHRVGGWLARGDGPGRTLAMPGHNPVTKAAAVEAGERLLRAAGLVLDDPRALPGAGAWQRAVAESLRRAADAAPGRAPFAFHAAAEAVASLDADLRANAAGQPLAPVADAYACVRLAVASAFECAHAVLRLDGRHSKRPSAPAGLRGGLGKAGSPKGVPGDLPPLM